MQAGEYLQRGIERAANGELLAAQADYDEAIRLSPQEAEAYWRRGLLRYALNDFDAAIADYTHAIELREIDRHIPFHNRANARQMQGDLAGAEADYDEALRLNPAYAVSYANRGIVRYDLGDYGGAIADYTDALALEPDMVAAYFNRANARRAQGEIREALSDYLAYLDHGGGERYGDRERVVNMMLDLMRAWLLP
jgi:tetratricopeptide (TPR) repeat protein